MFLVSGVPQTSVFAMLFAPMLFKQEQNRTYMLILRCQKMETIVHTLGVIVRQSLHQSPLKLDY
jgi:hypothetical protein